MPIILPFPQTLPTSDEERKCLWLLSFPLFQSPKENTSQVLVFLRLAERRLKYLQKVCWVKAELVYEKY